MRCMTLLCVIHHGKRNFPTRRILLLLTTLDHSGALSCKHYAQENCVQYNIVDLQTKHKYERMSGGL